jgi:hypothetical protein
MGVVSSAQTEYFVSAFVGTNGLIAEESFVLTFFQHYNKDQNNLFYSIK